MQCDTCNLVHNDRRFRGPIDYIFVTAGKSDLKKIYVPRENEKHNGYDTVDSVENVSGCKSHYFFSFNNKECEVNVYIRGFI